MRKKREENNLHRLYFSSASYFYERPAFLFYVMNKLCALGFGRTCIVLFLLLLLLFGDFFLFWYCRIYRIPTNVYVRSQLALRNKINGEICTLSQILEVWTCTGIDSTKQNRPDNQQNNTHKTTRERERRICVCQGLHGILLFLMFTHSSIAMAVLFTSDHAATTS